MKILLCLCPSKQSYQQERNIDLKLEKVTLRIDALSKPHSMQEAKHCILYSVTHISTTS